MTDFFGRMVLQNYRSGTMDVDGRPVLSWYYYIDNIRVEDMYYPSRRIAQRPVHSPLYYPEILPPKDPHTWDGRNWFALRYYMREDELWIARVICDCYVHWPYSEVMYRWLSPQDHHF